jgi:hypothetical protein
MQFSEGIAKPGFLDLEQKDAKRGEGRRGQSPE